MDPDLEFDAVILAGGRSSRLGGKPKHKLTYRGVTLLQRSLDAARGAAGIVVVGPKDGGLPSGVLTCREDPPFAGPAAAIAAGLAELSGAGALRPFTLVLACDMPRAGAAVQALREALRDGSDGVMAIAQDGRRQPLMGFYSTSALHRSVQDLASRGALINGSVRALVASLDVQLVTVPAGSTDDVDTWDDAAALGVASQEP